MLSGRRRGLVSDAAVLVVVLAAVVGFVVVNLRPWLWFTDTTPTGGDLGAHVWAPAYLRDVLIGELRLTGWTHDWYAGFPAFTFYMVIPSLLVVMIDVGLGLHTAVFAYLAVAFAAGGAALVVMRRTGRPASQCWAVALGVAGICGAAKLLINDPEADRALAGLLLPAVAAWWAWYGLRGRPRCRAAAAVAAAIGGLLVVPMPYGVALKLVTIAGVVALPVAVWAMARLGGVSTEGQALASAFTLLFLFDRSFNIYGGNLMSTMAGEFAYSLGLAGAVVFIGVAARGMPTGRHRVLAGALLALTGLMHLFSAFFALAAVAALLLVSPWRAPEWRTRLSWTVSTGALAAALSAWWVLPFWWNRSLLNDMGWGKERRYLSALWSRSEFDYSFLTNDPPLQLFVGLAAACAVVLFWRRSYLGMALVLTGAIIAVGFVILPEGRLWNVRILPFYYLMAYVTAALGMGELIRMGRKAIDRRQRARAGDTEDAEAEVANGAKAEEAEPKEAGSEEAGREEKAAAGHPRTRAAAVMASGAVALFTVAVMVMVGLPLRSLPGGQLGYDGVYRWGPFSSSESNLGSYWVEYNFAGYEGRGPTADGGGSSEYWDLVETMDRIGETHGCGPALWEYEAGRARVLRDADGPHAVAVLDRSVHHLHGGPLLRGLGHRPVPFLDAVGVVVRPVAGPARPALLGTRHRPGSGAHEAHGGSLLHGVLLRRGGPGPGIGRPHRDRLDDAGSVGRVRGVRERPGGRAVQAAGSGREPRRLERRLARGVGRRFPRDRSGRARASRRRSRRLAPDDSSRRPGKARRRTVRRRLGTAGGDAAVGGCPA